jgi:hypothetical protein
VADALDYSNPFADMDPEGPSTASLTATAANTAHQASLQSHTAAHMNDTVAASQYLTMDDVTGSTVFSTTTETNESLEALSAAVQAGLMDIVMEGDTYLDPQAAHMMRERDAMRFATTMDTESDLSIEGPITLTSQITFSPSLLSASHAIAASAEAHTALRGQVTCTATLNELSRLHTSSFLQQNNAGNCQEAVTIFDPGGCQRPALDGAVCSPQPL